MLITLRKFILSFFVALFFAASLFSTRLLEPQTVSAQSTPTCRYDQQCISNTQKCVCPPGMSYYVCRYAPGSSLIIVEAECGSAIIGGVEPPAAVGAINTESGGEIGAIFFASRLITFANIVAGILVMINFVMAGFTYITGAGNTATHQKVREKLTWSIVGVLVIVASYTLAAIIGLVFYGDPTFILTPTLQGAI